MTEDDVVKYRRELELAKRVLRVRETSFLEAVQRYFKEHPEDALVFSAYSRCKCGGPLFYRNGSERGMHGSWSCWAKEKGAEGEHAELPFAFYEVKCEDQPSANGATTRPPELPPFRSMAWTDPGGFKDT